MHAACAMGMIVVVGVLLVLGLVLALFVHAVVADTSFSAHGWLVVVPLLIIASWILAQLIMGS